jgi:hypothetical protein
MRVGGKTQAREKGFFIMASPNQGRSSDLALFTLVTACREEPSFHDVWRLMTLRSPAKLFIRKAAKEKLLLSVIQAPMLTLHTTLRRALPTRGKSEAGDGEGTRSQEQ